MRERIKQKGNRIRSIWNDNVRIRIGQINRIQGSNQSFGSTVSGSFYVSNKLNYLALR